MKAVSASLVLALSSLALFGPRPISAQDAPQACDVSYRLRHRGQDTHYRPGEVIVLQIGDRAELFIQGLASDGPDRPATVAEIDAPTAYGMVGPGRRDVDRVLRLGQNEPTEGKISVTAVAAGETALGYWIIDVEEPGRRQRIPASCRFGQVEITVEGAARSADDEAVHALITGLYAGILRRGETEAGDYPDAFFEQVQRGGLEGLISVAELITTSPEFRRTALDRTRQRLQASGWTGRPSPALLRDRLLTDIFQSLYGGEPDPDVRRLMADKLSGCLAGSEDLCRLLGSDLLAQPQYSDHHKDLLRHLRS